MVFSETIKAAVYGSEARAQTKQGKCWGLCRGFQVLVDKKKKRLQNDHEIPGFEAEVASGLGSWQS